MIDEVSETLGWERRHTIKALNGKVTLGVKAKGRGSKATHSQEDRWIIVRIWRQSEMPCGVLLKAISPLWRKIYAARYASHNATGRRVYNRRSGALAAYRGATPRRGRKQREFSLEPNADGLLQRLDRVGRAVAQQRRGSESRP